MVKFIDLFAGIGGFHEALKFMAECVFASEIDKYASQTYEANHGMKPHGDITKIDAKDIPAHDMLCAGFPCQSFSIAGKRLGFEDTRGTMFFEIARIVEHHRPKILLLENVKGLVNHDKGKTFKLILDTLVNLGYAVKYKVLNAKDYGIPQKRERIFIVGFLDKNAADRFEWPEKRSLEKTLSDVLEVLVKKDIANTVRSSGRSSGIHDRHNWDTYEVDGGLRKLTPRECARLQGFPDSFIIPVSNTQAYKQFGNAVCVNVVKAIMERIAKLSQT